MKICITAQGDSLDALVDPRFGRCKYFAISDTESLMAEFIENKDKDGMGGVGVGAGQLMADKGVEAVLTGNIGPNAHRTLQAGNIKVITGVSGKVIDAMNRFAKGELKSADGPNVDTHFGEKGEVPK